jgi:hypothetical protein
MDSVSILDVSGLRRVASRLGRLGPLVVALAFAACSHAATDAGAAAPSPAALASDSTATSAASPTVDAHDAQPFGYDRADAWLCRPDRAGDPCLTDLDATELRPDGKTVVLPFHPAEHPQADCFYVYPTVDMADRPGNHSSFADETPMLEATRAQVARFSAACRVFVPLYRQMTIGTYLATPEEHQRRFDAAFADVLAAFRYYQAHFDDGRGIVLLGHSQGAQMIEHLLQVVFDGDPAMRARLVVAMPIGGDVTVASGSTTGGTFQNLPICTSADEVGCVIAYATHSSESLRHPWPGVPEPGRRTACTNPASLGNTATARLGGTTLPTHSRYRDNMPGSRWAKTPFVVLRDFYAAHCVERPDGFSYLAVAPDPAPGDTRAPPIDLGMALWRQQVARVQLGLHILDFQFTQDELVKLVTRKAAAAAEKTAGPRGVARLTK